MKPNALELFYSPQSEVEEQYLSAGQAHYWQQYGKLKSSELTNFKGYILFSDPFHYGHKKISFLLGSDCSHFVHRMYQLFGANFPYAKTRHFIALAEALGSGFSVDDFYHQKANSGIPIDMPKCDWLGFSDRFFLIGNSQGSDVKLRVGDVIVFPKKEGRRGLRGHMGIIWQVSPLKMLHSKNKEEGIVLEELTLSNVGYYLFRWNPENELQWLGQEASFKILLDKVYPPNPHKCLSSKGE